MALIERGQTVNGYQIIRNLSSGAEGCAFEAQTPSKEPVFLKQFIRIKPASENGDAFRRIQEELKQRLAKIDSFVSVIKEVFIHEGSFIQVAEWATGQSLTDVLAHMEVDQRTLNATLLAYSLSKVHSQGIAHLDLKPDNVILEDKVNSKGESLRVIRVIDFDAAHIEGMENLEVMGTPGYASPEHFPGFRHKLGYPSQASDVFTLGIMLYQLLGPSYPFEIPAGLEFQDQMRALKDCLKDGHVRPLTDLDDSISPIVSDAVLKCLSLWPKDRPTAADVHRAFKPSDEPDSPGDGTATEIPSVPAADDSLAKGVMLKWSHGQIDIGSDEGRVLGRHTFEESIPLEKAHLTRHISRRHARVYRGSDGAWRITRLNETAAVLVNGIELAVLDQEKLKVGDAIKLGPVRLTVEAPEL